MGAQVALKVGPLRERVRALGALEGLLSAVHPHVVLVVGRVARRVRAEVAAQRLLAHPIFEYDAAALIKALDNKLLVGR